MCQVGKRPQPRIRADACRKKERLLFDTASLGTSCPGDPARRMLTARRDVNGLFAMLGYIAPSSLCRTLDTDPVACAAAFEPGVFGSAACTYVAGKCLACDLDLDAAGVCRNACAPPVTCADASRTLRTRDCEDLTTEATCMQAWAVSLRFATPTDVVRGASWWWNAGVPGVCRRCDPADVSAGRCLNSCIAGAELPACRQPGRSFGQCDVLDANPAVCALTYELARYGTQACWYDVARASCEGCDPVSESLGKCVNGC
jgi:hypothetical protein